MSKILLIEDEVLILRMYEKIFTYEGFEVISAEDGEIGLQRAKQDNPSLILLDIMMPKMDGLSVLTSLKQDPATQNIPVVVLTNLSSDEVVKDAFSRGAVGYLVKSDIVNERIVHEVKRYMQSVPTTPAN